MPRCNGCINNYQNQQGHECLMESGFKKDIYHLYINESMSKLYNNRMDLLDTEFGNSGDNLKSNYISFIRGLEMCKRNNIDFKLDDVEITINCSSVLLDQLRNYALLNNVGKELFKNNNIIASNVFEYSIDIDNVICI